MRVLFLTAHKYIPDIFGGMEKNTEQLTKLLLKEGLSVFHYCSLAGGLNKRGLNHKLSKIGKGCDLSLDKQLGYPVYVSFDILGNLNAVLNSITPDIIIIQGGYLYNELIESLALHSIPIVSYLHTPDRLLEKKLKIRPAHLTYIANSQFTADAHKDKTTSLIAPPIIEIDNYKVISTKTNMLFINPSKHKGVDIVLKLSQYFKNYTFDIVCATKAQYFDLENVVSEYLNINLHKPVNDMRIFYSNTYILLCPSQCDETWGRVATEVQVSGIPVLASNRGGLPESVGDGGLLINDDSLIEKWCESLQKIIDNYDIYSKNAAARSKREDISHASIVSKLIAHFEEVKNG